MLDYRPRVAQRRVFVYGIRVTADSPIKGGLMAENNETKMDYAEHERSYETFLWLTKWTVILTTIILILMAIFLV